MRKFLCIIQILLIISQFQANSQQRYWVVFKDKNATTFNPSQYFVQKAVERRRLNKIDLMDSTDFPLNMRYLAKVGELANAIGHQSRWLNALAISANDKQIVQIKSLQFVKEIVPIQFQTQICSVNLPDPEDELDTLLTMQTSRMGGDFFSDQGIDGKGVRIAIFDAGFPKVDVHPAFEHIRAAKRIIKTWDFAKNKENVYANNTHGTMVMSCIGGIWNGKKMGLATGAEFLLARTEVNSEPFSEEENWLAAVEWADKNGADIINSSLGYTVERYFNFEMDGRTSFVVKAAKLAAKKGILVINAMGNDGDNAWKIMGTPADADSILSIGGIDPYKNIHIEFSSFGPTADFRLKPNLSALGEAIVAAKGSVEKDFGTSFSTPLVSGFAACAWQTNRKLNNMQMMDELQKSGDLYPYYDYAHGYGVPQAQYFTNKNTKQVVDSTFQIIKEEDYFLIKVKDKYITNDGTNKLYYHISNKYGVLKKYAVLSVTQSEVVRIPIDELEPENIIRVFYRRFVDETEVKSE